LEKKQDSNKGVKKVFEGTKCQQLADALPHQNSEAYLQTFLGNRDKI